MNLAWEINLSKRAKKSLAKIDYSHASTIVKRLEELATLENPREDLKPLKGNLRGLYRKRVGDYRIIIDIFDEKLLILVIDLGHRKSIYK